MSETTAMRTTRTEAHRKSVQISNTDLVNALAEKLGTRLVCHMVQKHRSTVGRWRDGQDIPLESNQRLRVAYEVFEMLEVPEDEHTVRAWFIGMNPQLDDRSPIEAIAEGNYREVYAAARAYLAGG